MERKPNKPPIVDIYWRKLVVFALFFLFVFGVWKFFSSREYSADQPLSGSGASYVTTSEVTLEVKPNGGVYKDGQKIASKISPQKDFDELRLIVFDQNGYFLDNLTVNLKLPAEVVSTTNAQILAIHGVEATSVSKIDSSTIAYHSTSVDPRATITVIAQLPKGVISLPFYDQVIYLLSTFGSSVWLTLAIIVPILTLIYLILLISLARRAQKIVQPDRSISAPPMAIPPAVVGVLMNQRVGPREIAATLIDLSLRGYIYIIDRDRGFSFGKRNFTGQLLSFERILLSKIFRQSMTATEEQIDKRFVNHLYSRKMSLFSSGIYLLATRLGYFRENPAKMHRRYQFIGILLFFIALVCFLLTFKYFPTLTYGAFLWVGMMLAALIIVFVGSSVPIRTMLGRQALSNWLAFRKYLSDPQPLPYDQKNYQKFAEYLPYAIIFHSEAMWARRFGGEEFAVPDWFLTEKQGLGLNDFCLALYPIIGYVGQNLAAIREPGFK